MPTLVNNADGTASLVFAPGETSWLCPAGFTSALREEAWSAGAAGGTSDTTATNGAGGGAGAGYARNNNPTYVPGTVYSLVVGSGALGSASRTTTFGSTTRLHVPVGGAGGSVAALGNAGAGGTPTPAASIVGQVKFIGGSGAAGGAAVAGGGGGGAGDAANGAAASGKTGGNGGAARGGQGGSQDIAAGSYGGGGAGSPGLGGAATAAGSGAIVITFIPVALATVAVADAAAEARAAQTQDRASAASQSLDTGSQVDVASTTLVAVTVDAAQAVHAAAAVATTRQYARIIGYGLSGTARDYGTGAPIPNCTVKVFREPEDTRVAVLTTDTDGTWSQGVLQGYTYNVRYIKYGATHADDLTWATPEGNDPAVTVIADNL